MPTNIEIWASYSKDRFDSAAKRVDEFRNWARQLSAAVAVVIGLELTLVGRVLDLKISPGPSTALRFQTLTLFLVAVAIQIVLLVCLLLIGYVSRKIYWPESPIVLADYIVEHDAAEAQRVIGAYYAKSYERLFKLSVATGTSVGVVTIIFVISFLLMFAGVLSWVRLA